MSNLCRRCSNLFGGGRRRANSNSSDDNHDPHQGTPLQPVVQQKKQQQKKQQQQQQFRQLRNVFLVRPQYALFYERWREWLQRVPTPAERSRLVMLLPAQYRDHALWLLSSTLDNLEERTEMINTISDPVSREERLLDLYEDLLYELPYGATQQAFNRYHNKIMRFISALSSSPGLRNTLLRSHASIFPANSATRNEIIGMIHDPYIQSSALSDLARDTENIQQRLEILSRITNADVLIRDALPDVADYIRSSNASQEDRQRVRNFIHEHPLLNQPQGENIRNVLLSVQASVTENIEQRLGIISRITDAHLLHRVLDNIIDVINVSNASQEDQQRVRNLIERHQSLQPQLREFLLDRMPPRRRNVQVKTRKPTKGVHWKQHGITQKQQQKIIQRHPDLEDVLSGRLMTTPVRVPGHRTTYDRAYLSQWVNTCVNNNKLPNSPNTRESYTIEEDENGRPVMYVSPDVKRIDEMNKALTATLRARQKQRSSTTPRQGGGLQVKPAGQKKQQQQQSNVPKNLFYQFENQAQSKTPPQQKRQQKKPEQ